MRNAKRDKTMDLKRLEEMLDAYGTREEAWPAHEREQALALLQQSQAASRLRQEAATLDAMLDSLPALEPSAKLQATIMGAAPKPKRSWMDRLDQWAARMWPLGSNLQPAAALALAAAIGLLVGSVVPAAESDEQAADFTEIAFAQYSELGDDVP
ncbi:MAG: hypothetical protein MUF54_01995 [Polyangiaceae bacterium]|jgi:hypothetical protein|nr:hypothetical protein [Polyangiaceae bacterium]